MKDVQQGMSIFFFLNETSRRAAGYVKEKMKLTLGKNKKDTTTVSLMGLSRTELKLKRRRKTTLYGQNRTSTWATQELNTEHDRFQPP
jgi:hypothetical protein